MRDAQRVRECGRQRRRGSRRRDEGGGERGDGEAGAHGASLALTSPGWVQAREKMGRPAHIAALRLRG